MYGVDELTVSSFDSLFHHTVPKHDCLALHYVFVFATTQAKFAEDSIRNEGWVIYLKKASPFSERADKINSSSH